MKKQTGCRLALRSSLSEAGFQVSGFRFQWALCLARPAVKLFCCWALAAGMLAGTAHAATRTTIAMGYWTNEAVVWGGGNLPQAGDDVVVVHAVTLDESTPWLSSCSNTATLTFLGTNTALRSTNVYVNGTITHPAQTDVDGNPGTYTDWTPDSRIWIVCSNLTVLSGKKIDAMGAGYKSHQGAYGSGRGPGGGNSGSKVGSYGGGALPYGSATQPIDPGSGGGTSTHDSSGPSGYGGGAVRIEATGAVIVDGTITANGRDSINASADGGGSGGSVWITCRTIEGLASGLISANGGPPSTATSSKGGGSGGRIAIEVNTAAQSNVTSRPLITVSGGAHTTAPGAGGTLYVSHPMVLPETFGRGAVISWAAGNNWTANSLIFSNGIHTINMTNTTVQVAGDVDMRSATLNVMNYTTVQCANLLLTNASVLYVYAGVTNATWTRYGALVSASGNMDVHSNCVVYPYVQTSTSSPWVSGSPRFDIGNLTIHNGGSFNGNGLGYAGVPLTWTVGYGPGGGASGYDSGGGGYGGAGGSPSSGNTYGSATNPISPGSGSGGAGGALGAAGGGSVWIRATGIVRLDGTISVNGLNGGGGNNYSGGGSGGGVFIACQSFLGTTNIYANGGNSENATRGGRGGGGRIAVWYNTTLAELDAFLATGDGASRLTTNAPAGWTLDRLSVAAGTVGTAAGDGTKSFYSIPPPKGTMFLLR